MYKSERNFVEFSYSFGRGLLLLRSRKTIANPTRIDILVQDVRALEIRAWFDGIYIEEVDRDYLQGRPSKPAEMIESGSRIYALHGRGWSGFIVGGVISVQEDDGDFMAPSLLLGSALR